MTHTTKHTPGPWKSDADGQIVLDDQIPMLLENKGTDREWISVGEYDDEGMLSVVALTHPNNATLIAAAPAMYEALQWARQYLRMPNFHPDNSYNSEQWAGDYNKLTDALVQAEGRDK